MREKNGGMARAIKRYLFWRPPSPPRSSEKFLRFRQQQLNHREKRHSPISGEKEKRERATERKSDSPLFSPLHLVATNLIMCLHSKAAETCSLTYTAPTLSLSPSVMDTHIHTHARPHRLSLPLQSLFPSPSFPLLECRRGGLWSADVGPDSGGVESSASLSGKWPWMETNRQTEQPTQNFPPPFPVTLQFPLPETRTTLTRSSLARALYKPTKKFHRRACGGVLVQGWGRSP